MERITRRGYLGTIVGGLATFVLTSGCKDAKLKECIAKTEDLEQAFEELCEDGSESGLYIGGLYTLVKNRDEAWKEAGCGQYQARWICTFHLSDGLAGDYYTAEMDYGRKGEI